MRTELTSRLIALENQGGFVPTNVEITGYLHMLPGGSGNGEIETTSSITGESLYINSLAECGSIQCNGGLSATTLSAGTTTFGGNVTINGGSIISGNGSGLTNINDITKLPLTGGNISGTLGVGGTITMLGLAPVGYDNNIVHQDDSLIVASNGTQSQNLTLSTWSNTTSGLRISPASVLLGAGGSAAYYPTASIECTGTQVTLTGNTITYGNISVVAPGKFIGDGSLLTNVTATTSDPTKLPLTGGNLTGALTTSAGVNITCGGDIFGSGYKLSLIEFFGYDQAPNSTVVPDTYSKFTQIVLNNSNTVTVNLQNLSASTSQFPDGARYISITKRSMSVLDFVVTVIAPPGYLFYTPTAFQVSTITLGLGVFSNYFGLFQSNESKIFLLSNA
jgi:hypothetical protein